MLVTPQQPLSPLYIVSHRLTPILSSGPDLTGEANIHTTSTSVPFCLLGVLFASVATASVVRICNAMLRARICDGDGVIADEHAN